MKRMLIAGLLAVAALPALGHHSIAVHYDQSQIVQVDGVVTQYLFTNPHVYLYLETVKADGSKALCSGSSRHPRRRT